MLKTSLLLGCLLAALVFAVRAEDRKKDSSAPKPPTFKTPKGWKAVDPGVITSARFEIGEKDRIASVTVTGLSGEGGGLTANVNRWREQIGLKSLAEKDVLKSLQEIKVDGISGHAVDLTGPDRDGKVTQRILAAVVKRGDQTWFFKLSGPAGLVGEQKAAFEEFLKSVRFEK